MTRLVMLDTETTSLDDQRGEVWEIGLIVRDPGQADVEHLWQLWPDLSTADPMSLRLSRFYERNVLLRPGILQATAGQAIRIPRSGEPSQLDIRSVSNVAAQLASILDGAHVVGAVPDFDYRFLRRWLAKWGQCWTAHYHLIDVEALAVGYLTGAAKAAGSESWVKAEDLPWYSKDIYRRLGLDWSRGDEHTALGAARLVRSVFDAVTGGA